VNIAFWFLLGVLTVAAVGGLLLWIDHRHQRAAREATLGFRTTSSHGLALTSTPRRQRYDPASIVTRRFYGEREIHSSGR
jgi:hypothetical protein